MEAFYDASTTANILLRQVLQDLKITETIEDCVKTGLDKKIFKECKRRIERKFEDKNFQELLKFFVASYFIDESIDVEELQDEGSEHFERYSDLEKTTN